MPGAPSWPRRRWASAIRAAGDDEEAINRSFTPDFRNRLDAIIAFGALPTEVVHKVVQKFVLQLEGQLADRGVTFELDEKAIAWLAERGYDERMGARPLGRLIQEEIKKPLAEEVLFGKLQKGGIVKVSVEEKEEGGTGLKLESIPDENAQRKEKPLRGPRSEPEVESDLPGTRPVEGGGSVPRVPLKV
jgi:ATP-dependent Clp protease ATP-binding subunit ClpA